jgi:hypothetical protein
MFPFREPEYRFKQSKGGVIMEFRWQTFANNKKRHAFPADEKRYGDWSVCGRGSGLRKAEGNEALCGKCLMILEKYSDEELESKRIVLKSEMDLHEDQGV